MDKLIIKLRNKEISKNSKLNNNNNCITTEYRNLLLHIVKAFREKVCPRKLTIAVVLRTNNKIKNSLHSSTYKMLQLCLSISKMKCDDCEQFCIVQIGIYFEDIFKERLLRNDKQSTDLHLRRIY